MHFIPLYRFSNFALSKYRQIFKTHAHVTTAHDRVTIFSRYDTFSNLNSCGL